MGKLSGHKAVIETRAQLVPVQMSLLASMIAGVSQSNSEKYGYIFYDLPDK